MYPEEIVKPMREQLTNQGFSELKSTNDVDNMISNNDKKENISDGFKPIHNLTSQDIKNEKIDIIKNIICFI